MTVVAFILATGNGVPFILFPIAMLCDTALITVAMLTHAFHSCGAAL